MKLSTRLLDLHDSRRGSGESPQYQTEDRPGLGDGRYIALAQAVLDVLQKLDARTGDEFSSLQAIQQGVCEHVDGAEDIDIEYVLNVLSRPSELKLLHSPQEGPAYVIGDKETNLVEKAAHVVEYRLSRLGKLALVIASDHMDIAYIEGDVTKLIRAIQAARLGPALGFVERLLQQLRSEQLKLVALIEKTAGGRRARQETLSQMELHRETMRRTVNLVQEASFAVDEIVRKEVETADDVPVGLIRAKVKELAGGVVRYGRELTRLAELSMVGKPSTVQAPDFAGLARQWVKTPPEPSQVARVLEMLGPGRAPRLAPMGSDFAGIVKARSAEEAQAEGLQLEGFDIPAEDQFTDWLQKNLSYLESQLHKGVTLGEALRAGLGHDGDAHTLNSLVTALTAAEDWVKAPVEGELARELERFDLPGLQVMFSSLKLQMASDDAAGKDR
ncbi:hypothetical protein [Variovorax sp. KBW07]|uniref:hypothetical protein n=1 Tax=Variovorax sp. KBW07 TaxID=2153358 RepID=UPI000F57E2BA|nr:hypothetical protein [Variovorax sp. KBW07]